LDVLEKKTNDAEEESSNSDALVQKKSILNLDCEQV
jgi:hypothetical protein